MITENQEDYLRAMYKIEEDNEEFAKKRHIDPEPIRANSVATYMTVSKPSVTKMMGELKEKGLVKYEKYGTLEFTKKGKEIAEELTKKHRLIELFLQEVLKITPSKVHNLAHKLEHAFDDECIEKIKGMLPKSATCPHGRSIPE